MSKQDGKELKDESEEQQNQDVEMSEEPGVNDKSQIEILDGNELETAKRKILIQRIFHCTDKHTVEQKLNYVIVNSEEEVTKLVYGGLFRNKYYKYCPEDYCKKHAPNLSEHEDETLVRLGDKFESLECFRLYVDANARAWKYYLKCADSHRKNGKDTFVFQCVFAKQRKKMSSAKGLRKRTFALPRCECPCRVILKPVPFGADDLTVIYVCNHHDHPLTDDYFSKLQHGRRIHPSIKEELMDLLALEVDREIVRKYFESITGYSMNYAFFNNMIINMKKKKVERQVSFEKLKEMYKKIEKIKEEMGIYDDFEENVDNDFITDDNINKDQASQVVEVMNVLKSVTSKIRQSTGKRRSKQELGETPSRKRQSKQQTITEDEPSPKPQTANNRSRLETRLQELKHDRETLQSIKHLQDSVRCEAEKNPWVIDHVPEPKSISVGNKAKRVKNSQKPTSNVIPEIVPQAIIIETPQTDEAFVQNEEIIYDNDITVVETTGEEIPDSVANVVQVVDLNEINIDDNVSYCIQYDDGQQGDNQEEQQFVLMYDEGVDIENIPEVQIQATEFATVSITSDNNKIKADVQNEENCALNVPEDSVNENNDVQATTDIQVVNEDCCDESEIIEENVYEVIQTNDKKILPSKDIVDTVILNKRPKPERRSNNYGHYETTGIPKDLKYSKSGKKSLEHNRISRKTKLGRTQDNDVEHITQYFKEKTEEYINSVVKKDLDKLDDDECYMIVIDDEKEQNCQDEQSYEEWVESLKDEVESNNDKHNRQPRFVYEDSVTKDEVESNNDKHNRQPRFVYEDSVTKDEVESNNDKHNRQPRFVYEDSVTSDDDIKTVSFEALDGFDSSSTGSYEDNLVKYELYESDKCYSSKRKQREREKIKLERAVKCLKRQKYALEQDVKKLVAKKELIKNINRETRNSKRRFYR